MTSCDDVKHLEICLVKRAIFPLGCKVAPLKPSLWGSGTVCGYGDKFYQIEIEAFIGSEKERFTVNAVEFGAYTIRKV